MPSASKMRNEPNNIGDLLPHRQPFLFADDIVSATKEEIIAITTFQGKDSWLRGSFPQFNFVPGTILLESMAQCGGAAIKLMGVTDGLFALTTIEHAEFFRGAEYDKPVKYIIKNVRLSDKLIKQSGVAFVEEVPVLEATWLCVKVQ